VAQGAREGGQMTPDGIRTFSIDDWTAEEARLIMALWLVQSGAKMSTHFTTPAGEDSLITDPLGIVMVRGPEGVEALTAWVRQRQEGMIVVPAGPAMSAVRSIDDTQQAHDVLWSVVMDGKLAERIGLSAWDKRIAQASLEAMCYVLRHEHGGRAAGSRAHGRSNQPSSPGGRAAFSLEGSGSGSR